MASPRPDRTPNARQEKITHNIIRPPPLQPKRIIQPLNIRLTDELRRRARHTARQRLAIQPRAVIQFLLAAAGPPQREVAVVVDGVVDQLQAVRVLAREAEEVLRLRRLVDDGVDHAETFHVELAAGGGGILVQLLVLLVEVCEEGGAPVAAEGLGPGFL